LHNFHGEKNFAAQLISIAKQQIPWAMENCGPTNDWRVDSLLNLILKSSKYNWHILRSSEL